jgi:hypothetical protein
MSTSTPAATTEPPITAIAESARLTLLCPQRRPECAQEDDELCDRRPTHHLIHTSILAPCGTTMVIAARALRSVTLR